jgi:hypothetical protein
MKALQARRAPPEPALQPKPQARRIVTVIALGLFCTTFGQPSVAGGYPIRFFLKDHLLLDPSQVSTFFLVVTFFWYLKPLAGILSDSFPIFGTRRKHYLAISALGSSLLWLVLGYERYHYRSLLVATLLLNGFLVMGSTVSGGMLVVEAQEIQATGRLSALRQLVSNVALLIAGPAGIWAYDHLGFDGTAALIGASFMPLAILTLAWLPEEGARPSTRPLARVKEGFVLLGRARSLWAAAGMWALVALAPGFGTLLVYRQTDVLHFSHEFVGRLAFVSALGGILASVLYGFLCRFFSLRVLLPLSILATGGAALLYLAYDRQTAIWVDGVNGCLGVFALLPLFDMAARATPRAAAALGYSLLMSVNNLIVQGSDKIGSVLYVTFHWQFHSLVWLNALTTLATLVAVPFLPATLMEERDA